MNSTLLVTHRFRKISLIIALEHLGVNVVFCNNLHEVKIKAHDSIGYFGSLFTEIKKPLSFILALYKLRKENTPYIFWNRDAPWHCGIKKHRKLLLRILKPADIYFAHSLQDASWFTRKKPIFLPNAAQDKYLIDPLPIKTRDQSHYKYDVSFIGSIGNMDRLNCIKRKNFLDAVKQIISYRGIDIKFITIDTYHNPITIDEQISIIKKSKINLNIGAMCDLQDNPSWGLPERAFGIPAAGGFLLTDWRETIPDTFPGNKCDFYRDPNECANKIIHYLSNFSLSRFRAEKLHDLVIKKYTYNDHAIKVLDILMQHN